MSTADRKALHVRTPEERRAQSEAAEEAGLQKLCEQELNRNGIAYLHLSPRAREKKGWPDLTFVVNGIPVAVELKSATGTLSADQKAILDQMERNGWKVAVVRNFDGFNGVLNKWGRILRKHGVVFEE